jgi:hypothetical protein
MKRILDNIYWRSDQSRVLVFFDSHYLNLRLWAGKNILLKFGYCWADIVLWAYGYKEPNEINKRTGCKGCDPDCKAVKE